MLGYIELTSSKTLIDGSIEISITFYSNNKNIADKIKKYEQTRIDRKIKNRSKNNKT